jgi:UDP-galactopyranose mutase
VSALRFDVLCFSHLRWDFVWQRPQQLLSRCSRDRRVFFVEEPVLDEGPPRLDVRDARGGVRVAVPRLPYATSPKDGQAIQQRLVQELLQRERIEEYVLWYYTPLAVPFTRGLAPVAAVYDCMDELSAFVGAPPELHALEEELFGRVDLVFTGGRSLYDAKRERHANVHLFPSSVETAHFAKARDSQPDVADQAPLPRPRIGWFGVIDERMDLELLAALADARPHWQLVLVGPVVKIDADTLPARRNIHYLGPRDYAELPRYLAGWDVAMLPFGRNEATRFISPTKTPEYLAAGRPVVSTSIRDVISPYAEQGLVRIANEPEPFARACEEAMAEDADERARRVDAFLTEMSWDFTWADMVELVERSVRARQRAATRRCLHRREGFDWLVVGAGFAGSVLAERLATQANERVLVCDVRNHVGGNAYDHYDDAGILVHRYGPHIFHTNSREVFDHLSQFTDWRPYEHRVLASVDGMLVPLPINLDTINTLYNLDLSADDVGAWLAGRAEPRARIETAEDAVTSKVGRDLYLKFFRNYTRKQWGLDPSELDASVTSRVPSRTSRDARYFTDTYQAMPLHGYTRMFERMLDHPNIGVLLNTDWREVDGFLPYERLAYTGPIDEYFDLRYGKLPYRSLEFRFETRTAELVQPVAVINHPNEYAYTRVTEFKHLTGQEHSKTTLVYEYPSADGDPYYPVPQPENAELYKEYKRLADAETATLFVGRLATYKYYNMDQVVAQALAAFRRLGNGSTEDDVATAPLTRAARAVGRAGVHGRADR